jgi:hypothetical protein
MLLLVLVVELQAQRGSIFFPNTSTKPNKPCSSIDVIHTSVVTASNRRQNSTRNTKKGARDDEKGWYKKNRLPRLTEAHGGHTNVTMATGLVSLAMIMEIKLSPGPS